MILGGVVLLHKFPKTETVDNEDNPAGSVRRRHYAFSGHARSGCATPPEFQAHLEHGISRIIPEL
jgi:hypothetical protein